jgi:uncharacterized membrane protein HdeD (DUF308 family)
MEALADNFEQGVARIWKALALRGAISIAFGVVLLVWPELSLRALVLAFAAFVAASGLVSVYAGVKSNGSTRARVGLLLQGLVSIGFGVVAFVWTDMTERALLYTVGAWAILFGTIGVLAGMRLPARRSTKALFVLDALLAVVFGFVMFASPDTGALALVALIAALAIVTGTSMTTLAFELRRHGGEVGRRIRAAEASSETSPRAVTQP